MSLAAKVVGTSSAYSHLYKNERAIIFLIFLQGCCIYEPGLLLSFLFWSGRLLPLLSVALDKATEMKGSCCQSLGRL